MKSTLCVRERLLGLFLGSVGQGEADRGNFEPSNDHPVMRVNDQYFKLDQKQPRFIAIARQPEADEAALTILSTMPGGGESGQHSLHPHLDRLHLSFPQQTDETYILQTPSLLKPLLLFPSLSGHVHLL